MQMPFSSLSHQGQVRRITSLARAALAGYPLREPRLRLVKHGYNTMFRVGTPDGDQYVLRVHNPRQTSVDVVRSEMLWLAALRRETSLLVPEPVENSQQRLVTVVNDPGVPQPQLCVLFRWIEGRFHDRGLMPRHLRRVGELMARLHQHAASWTQPPGFRRPRVDNLFCLERERNDEFDEAVAARAVQMVAAANTPEAGAVVEVAIHRVWDALRALGQGPDQFGLIHADLHQRNYLFHRGVLAAIDFDDCGYGHWLYDFAVTLTQLERRPSYPDRRKALLEGYRQTRSLPAEFDAYLDAFLALRRIQDLLGMIEERCDPTCQDRWHAIMLRELEQLRAFIAG
jgi:Ser/Thr protein kinase RdoA (MazF antagonist)